MTLTNIEKAAKLMGLKLAESLTKEKPHFHPCGSLYVWRTDMPELIMPRWFNPYTNKADLSDVIDELGIDVGWRNTQDAVIARNSRDLRYWNEVKISNHPDKFTARAHAVMAVVEQIYDAKFGKDGE